MSENPILIPQAFASNGSKNTIQNTRQTGQDPEDATWSEGFPNVTMQPMESGGLPPKGMDFNGILHALSASIVHQQKGGFFYFDSNHANAIGGYSTGAILIADDHRRLFISTIDKNKTNPNQNPTGWKILAGEGVNATTATKLQTPRYINGVLFDGGSDINVTPPGAVQFFAQPWAPVGWLKANGAEVSRTTYANLFAAIGTHYGAGNGSTTFNLPDLRGEFLRSWDDGKGVDKSRLFGGWQDSDNKAHQHYGTTSMAGSHHHSGTTQESGYHTHPVGRTGGGSGTHAAESVPGKGGELHGGGIHQHNFSTDWVGDHSHNFTTSFSGGDESRPRNIALLACIKI